jgi:sugar (pentulose or hexulose) kinase
MLPPHSDNPALAVVDLGKSRAKVSVLTADGRIQHSMDAGAAAIGHLGDGTIALDKLNRWCENTLVELHRRHPFHHIMPVTHGATAVILDAGHEPWPVPDYEAPISPALAAVYETLRPPFSETGSPSLPLGLNLGRQLYIQELADPARFAASAAILTYPQYWTWRWSGASGTDVSSLGCHTDLWQPQRGTWSRLAALRGWNHRFPALVRAGAAAAPLRGELASRLGAVDVHWGAHDSNAALAAFLGAEESFTLISSGTWLVAFAVGAQPPPLDERRDTLWNVDVDGRPVAAARCMAGREREIIAGAAPAAAATALAALLATGAMALPAFAAGGPYPHAVGTIDARGSAVDRAALASLYLALMIDTMLDLLGARGALIVEGPLAGDEAALAALAALRPRQTVRATQVNCVAHGAARLVFGAARLAPPATRVIAPDAALIAPIDAHRQRWRRALNNNSATRSNRE